MTGQLPTLTRESSLSAGARRNGPRVGARARCALLITGLAALLGAWIMSTAPFAGPDEQSHYIRAIGVSEGVILGTKIAYNDPGLTPTQNAFIGRDTRTYEVARGMSPYDVGCDSGTLGVSGCLEASPNGNFPPLGYVLPALALRLSHNVSSALWLGRVGSAIQSFAFLALATALLWNATAWSLVGLIAAISPMVLFVASVLNPSGVQITAALALGAAGVRIARDPRRVPPWVLVAFATSGVVTILAGPIGLAFALIDGCLLGLLLGLAGIRGLWQGNRRALAGIAAVLVLAALLSLIYTHIAGFQTTFGFTPFGSSLDQGLDQLPTVLESAVGNFGAAALPIPLAACWVYWGLVLVLLAAALAIGGLRERLMLIAVTLVGLAFPVLYWAWIDRFSGFPVFAREVMPPLLLIPLAAGEVIYVRRAVLERHRWARPCLAAMVVSLVLFQAYAWAFNRNRAPHDVTLLPKAVFTPPLGWTPWVALAAVGIAMMLAFVALDVLGPPRRRQIATG